MTSVLSTFAGCIFTGLSILHLYWMFGGKWGKAAAIPCNGSRPLFTPSTFSTFIVALLLAAAAVIAFGLSGGMNVILPAWMYRWGGWSIGIVFLLRSIGEFRWVGFFKKKKGTAFARWDSMLFSPLCLLLAISVITVLVFEP
ncbi:DUF3995 domain-containing protein [Paenibacillus apiarius]|uniref:DUF3995 domain-containing protein n=1 Tax=Paenibacillus apiarius TaxID=46240 RepID=A0ABT4DVD6_9BACL|nr:DUF3995 domain-containing protein [Paenibacillus apiarius]MCY9514339.1 DUF3995 domain-containing protein [Paenibacillus apiarius]MCY9520078.1 DUF3995 domain-containing protein [Paenibacillus apiarius]MCY9550084.1 DUF3995 domain-containing protein [Paenibacillus apiarius]MCY9560304.1 DUF3995 domain-containing protein [Paenibacillus apiarius]MCY9683201.1 DUF3995 domain-containing protein [Paenibacillus apiarius]